MDVSHLKLALSELSLASSRYQLRQIIFSMSTFVPVRVLLSFDQGSFIETVARRMMQQIMDHKQEIPPTTFNSMLRSFRPACEDVDKSNTSYSRRSLLSAPHMRAFILAWLDVDSFPKG